MDKEETLYEQQKKCRPKMEEIISTNVKDESNKKNILDFIAWLRKNKMSPSWYATNAWKVGYQKRRLFRVWLDHDAVHIRFPHIFTDEYQAFIASRNLQNTVWDNMYICQRFEGKRCNGCPPPPYVAGSCINICGKKMENLCRGIIMYFVNPDYTTLQGLKQLLEFEMLPK